MPIEPRPLLAGDQTAWLRPEARTLRDRTIEHQPTAIAGNKLIAVGQGFTTIGWIPEMEGSWALPGSWTSGSGFPAILAGMGTPAGDPMVNHASRELAI